MQGTENVLTILRPPLAELAESSHWSSVLLTPEYQLLTVGIDFVTQYRCTRLTDP